MPSSILEKLNFLFGRKSIAYLIMVICYTIIFYDFLINGEVLI